MAKFNELTSYICMYNKKDLSSQTFHDIAWSDPLCRTTFELQILF